MDRVLFTKSDAEGALVTQCRRFMYGEGETPISEKECLAFIAQPDTRYIGKTDGGFHIYEGIMTARERAVEKYESTLSAYHHAREHSAGKVHRETIIELHGKREIMGEMLQSVFGMTNEEIKVIRDNWRKDHNELYHAEQQPTR